MIHFCISRVVTCYIYNNDSSRNCSEGRKGLRHCKCPGGDAVAGVWESGPDQVAQWKNVEGMYIVLLMFYSTLIALRTCCVSATLQRLFPYLVLLSQVYFSCRWTEIMP